MNAKTKLYKCLGHLFIIIILHACSQPPVKPPQVKGDAYEYTKKYSEWVVQNEVEKWNITGLSIALIDDQNIVWARGFGYADKENNIKADENSIFRAGSITKLFTDTAVMQLAEKGQVDIDKPLKIYLPEFTINSRFSGSDPITPRNIMTHHSGLPMDYLGGMFTKQVDNPDQLVELIKNEYVAYPSNKLFAYSNVAVSLLGIAIARVSGESYADYIRDNILKPAGMSDSEIASGISGTRAYKNGDLVEELPLRDIAAGGLNTSARDLAQFVKMVFGSGSVNGNTIIRPETLKEMLRAQNDNNPYDMDIKIGLGWPISLNQIGGAGPVILHAGGTMYHQSLLVAIPRHKLGIVLLSNSKSAGMSLNKIATSILKVALETKTGIKQLQKAPTIRQDQPSQVEPGFYATKYGLTQIRKEDEKLKVDVLNNTFNLSYGDDGRLHLDYRLLGFIPINLGELGEIGFSTQRIDNQDILVSTNNQVNELFGTRIDPVVIPDVFKQYLGEYSVPEVYSVLAEVNGIDLSIEHDFLVMNMRTSRAVLKQVLLPVNEHQAIKAGLGRGLGDTVLFETHQGKRRMRYSGLVLGKIEN